MYSWTLYKLLFWEPTFSILIAVTNCESEVIHRLILRLILQNLGTYTWMNTVWPVIYTDWAAGEPSVNTGGCVSINSTTGKWHTANCTEKHAFVCKITSGRSSSSWSTHQINILLINILLGLIVLLVFPQTTLLWLLQPPMTDALDHTGSWMAASVYCSAPVITGHIWMPR